MALELEGSVGVGGENQPRDVAVVEQLLRTIAALPPSHAPGVCDQVLEEAITDFQRLYDERADGRVDPRGRTLGRLNAVATPPVLEPVALKRLKQGGYKVSWTGAVPPRGYSVFFHIQGDQGAVDITGAPQQDALDFQRLQAVLEAIAALGAWGTSIPCFLTVRRNGQVVHASNAVSLPCPVRPWKGPLAPSLGAGDDGPHFPYLIDGRFFPGYAVRGRHYFVYGGQLETDNTKRGFNCITFAGSVLGVDPGSRAMSQTGLELASYLCAVPVGLEGVSDVEVKAYLSTPPGNRGLYLVWRPDPDGHVILVEDGIVHEFNIIEPQGYRTKPVGNRGFVPGSYWVRRIDVSKLHHADLSS